LAQSDRKTLEIRIINADIWAAGWITYHFYKYLDEGTILDLNLVRVSKSEKSIDLSAVVQFLIGYAAGRATDIPVNHVERSIREMLANWKRKREQTDLRIFIDKEEVK
jgi:hypothetical protein